jgi:hypothetical protein
LLHLKKKLPSPASIKEKFGDRRRIIAKDHDILNYENAQMLLINARKKYVQEELGIDLNEEREPADTAKLFKKL